MTFPAVAKIASPDILHKSDVGGVKLNLMDACQVEKAYREIMENVKVKCPGAKIDGVLIQSMLPQGVEMIIGVNTDPQFGPMILCGLGGVFVEVFKDVSLHPAPLNKQEARDMIWSLKGSKPVSYTHLKTSLSVPISSARLLSFSWNFLYNSCGSFLGLIRSKTVRL